MPAEEQDDTGVIVHVDSDGNSAAITTAHFSKGEVVMSCTIEETQPFPDRHSIQLDHNLHTVVPSPIKYMNHACGSTANVGCVRTFADKNKTITTALSFVALYDLEPGTSILWDYETSEYDMSNPFDCLCGDDNCRGVIRGYRYAIQDEHFQRQDHEQFIAPYLLREKMG